MKYYLVDQRLFRARDIIHDVGKEDREVRMHHLPAVPSMPLLQFKCDRPCQPAYKWHWQVNHLTQIGGHQRHMQFAVLLCAKVARGSGHAKVRTTSAPSIGAPVTVSLEVMWQQGRRHRRGHNADLGFLLGNHRLRNGKELVGVRGCRRWCHGRGAVLECLQIE